MLRQAGGAVLSILGLLLMMFWFYHWHLDPGGAISASEALPALPVGLLLFIPGLILRFRKPANAT